jgi:hypothetical protein
MYYRTAAFETSRAIFSAHAHQRPLTLVENEWRHLRLLNFALTGLVTLLLPGNPPRGKVTEERLSKTRFVPLGCSLFDAYRNLSHAEEWYRTPDLGAEHFDRRCVTVELRTLPKAA